MASSDRNSRFASKVCLVLGGSGGVGLTCAKAFAREGAKVVIVARNEERLASATEDIGNDTVAISAPLDTQDGINRVATRLSQTVENVDVVFYSVGIGRFSPLAGLDEQTWDSVFDTNVKGVVFLVQALESMLAPGSAIVLCGSASARRPGKGLAAYGTSKAALEYLTRVLAAELVSKQVRVNIVVPGGLATNSTDTGGMTAAQVQALREQIRRQTPMGREGTLDELADAVLFLASDEASYITGARLALDGGLTTLSLAP